MTESKQKKKAFNFYRMKSKIVKTIINLLTIKAYSVQLLVSYKCEQTVIVSHCDT